MNRTKIEWTDYTHNPVVGCFNNCHYCYAKRQAKRHCHICERCGLFEPHLHPERLDHPCRVKRPSLIFVCSMGELFGPWVPQEWIDSVMDVARRCQQHIFQFLTKCPARLQEVCFGENCWVGTSIDTSDNLWRKDLLMSAKAPVRFISFEPLLNDMSGADFSGVDWIIIGAQTGPQPIKPEPTWVQWLIDKAQRASIPVFVKDNVNWPETVREWPRAYRA